MQVEWLGSARMQRTISPKPTPFQGLCREIVFQHGAVADLALAQAANVAMLPGIVGASCPTRTGATAFRSAAWRHSMPMRAGSASTSPAACAALRRADILAVQQRLADALYERIPAGVGSTGSVHLNQHELEEMLTGGAARCCMPSPVLTRARHADASRTRWAHSDRFP